MKAQDCKAIRRQIEETDLGKELGSLAASHVRGCHACREFYENDKELRRVVGSLAPVEAPADFDFRLRARLANERNSSIGRSSIMRMSFAIPSMALVAFILLAGSVFVWRSLQNPPVVPPNVASDNGSKAGQANPPTFSPAPPAALVETVRTEKTNPRNLQPKTVVGLGRKAIASTGSARMSRNEFSYTGANVLRREETALGTQLPINLPVQTLRVSVDDGSGISRTISFPTVSFGSERVLTRTGFTGQPPAKSDW